MLIILLAVLLAVAVAVAIGQTRRANAWKADCQEANKHFNSASDRLISTQRKGDQIVSTLAALGVWSTVVHRWDQLDQKTLDQETDRLTKAIAGLKSNACSDELSAEVAEARETVRVAQEELKAAAEVVRHYREVFVVSVMKERDRWHDMYIDAITTYGNAQDRYERAIEYLSKRAKVPFPAEVRAVMEANRKAAETGRAQPKLEVKEGERPHLA